MKRLIWHTGSLVVLALYALPYFLHGTELPIPVHDHMDSNIAMMKLLMANELWLSPPGTREIPVMGGLPLISAGAVLDLPSLVFYLFGIFPGYVINKVGMLLLGYLAMFIFLRDHLGSRSAIILHGVALCYGMLPFWSFAWSLPALPLFAWSFLHLRKGNSRFYHYLISFLSAFLISPVLVGVFVLIVAGMIATMDFFRNRRAFFREAGAIILLGIGFGISYFRYVYHYLVNSEYTSHRREFDLSITDPYIPLKNTVELLISGQYHALSLHGIILLFIPVYLVLSARKKIRISPYFWAILGFIGLTSLIYFLNYFPWFKSFIEPLTSVIPIQVQRFHFLHPFAWYVLFAIMLFEIAKLPSGKLAAGGMLVFQIALLFTHFEGRKYHERIAWEDFYDEAVFSRVKAEAGRDAKFISIAMHPSAAQFCGLETLDGYFFDYPLDYKHEFRELIAGELDRDSALQRYFDVWGSRCYAFSSEIGKDYTHKAGSPLSIDTLDYDWKVFRELGGTHVLSAVPIRDPDLKEVGRYQRDGGYWEVFLYEPR